MGGFMSNICDLFPRNQDKLGENHFYNLKNIKCLKFKLKNDTSFVIVAQSFPQGKSTFLLEFPLFSIDLLNFIGLYLLKCSSDLSSLCGNRQHYNNKNSTNFQFWQVQLKFCQCEDISPVVAFKSVRQQSFNFFS